ncbi:MAG: HDOD domain-containing protein [Pseudomonadota bacterium]
MSDATELKQKIRSLEEIPTLPAFFNKLMETIECENASVKDLAKIISEDPALTSKLLKLANSAYYGRFKTISTTDQAVATVGFNEIKTISLSIAVFGAFSSKITNQSLENFWIHALMTATAIKLIGNRGQETSMDKLYFAGLLHDIGKLVLCLLIGNDYLRLLSTVDSGDLTLDIEKTHYGVTHATVGKWLAERWHFPNDLKELIAHHHVPMQSGLLRPRSIATIYVGDFIAHSRADCVMPDDSNNMVRRSMDLLELNDDDVLSTCERVTREEERIRETFSLIA